ncbi:hypothetical protein WJX77_007015 [Trebouxia sp. C0004]
MLENSAGAREVRLRQRRTLKDIRQEEAALSEARQSKLDCNAAQEASASDKQRAAELQKQIEDQTARILPMDEQENTSQPAAVAAAHGNVGTQDLQNVQRQLNEKTIEFESLEGSLQDALGQACWAINDAEMWQGAYQQTVSADLERENGKLLYDNRELSSKSLSLK